MYFFVFIILLITFVNMKLTGNITFDPPNKTNKHVNQSNWKRVAMVIFDSEIDDYYRWFINRRYNLQLNSILRKPHITFINDKYNDVNKWEQVKFKYNGTTISINIDLDVRTNGEHWWFKIEHHKLLNNIRVELGLNESPYYPPHMSIGFANNKNIEHSKYIKSNIDKFGNKYI